MNVFMIIIIAIAAALLIAPLIARKLLYSRLIRYLGQQDYESFNALLDGLMCTFLFRPFNREFLRLNAVIAENDDEKVMNQLKLMFSKLKMNDVQKNAVSEKGFYFYMDLKEYDRAAEMLNSIKHSKEDSPSLHNMQMLYDILAEHKSSYINEIKQKVDQIGDTEGPAAVQLGIFQYMLGLQYSYKNDRKTAADYLNRAEKNCRGTIYETAAAEAAAGLK